MAAASHFTAGVYGTVAGQPNYTKTDPNKDFSNFNAWSAPAQMSFPAQGTVIHEVNPGVRVGTSSNYIYSVIEIVQSGLQSPSESTKYASNALIATLITNVG